MKTNAEPTFVQTSNVGETKRATIKTSAKLFNFLSGQIYSNKFTAIWRELVANGVDAQKINGSTRSIEVTLPSILEPHAKVRDFGTGMGHDFMMNQFMAFADASTKDNSDEFIGGFGIGSKAPLSYTDQYSIKCFQNGVVRVYSVFKDDEGCPAIAFLSEAETTEPDGVEVGFPVRQDDIVKFNDAVQTTLQYFKPLPVLKNTDLTLLPIDYDAKGDNWGLKLNSADRNPKVIIGGVAYPLNAYNIPYEYEKLRSFMNLGLDIYLNIGDAEIALSRESVTQDEKLYAKLNNIAVKIGDDFGTQLSKAFESCKTLWEAKVKLNDSTKSGDYTSNQLLKKFARWKGDTIQPHVMKPAQYDLMCIAFGTWAYGQQPRDMSLTQAVQPKFRIWPALGTFMPDAFDRIIIVNTEDRPILRVRTVINQYPNERLLFIKDNSEKKNIQWKQFLKDFGSPPASMVDYLSKYQPAVVPKGTSTGSTRPFKCYVQGHTPYRGQSDYQQALPSEGGIYFTMDNFIPDAPSMRREMACHIKPKNVIWLNKTDYESSGIDKNPLWLSVDQALAKLKPIYAKKHKNLAQAEAYYKWSRTPSAQNLSRSLIYLERSGKMPKRGPLAALAKLFNLYNDVCDGVHSKIRLDFFDVTYDTELFKIEGLYKDALAKHPVLFDVITDTYLTGRLKPEALARLF